MAKLPKDGPIAVEGKNRKPRVFLRVPPDAVKDIQSGDMLTVSFSGKVVGFSISETGRRKSADVDLEDPDVKVKKQSGQIAKLDEAMDEEAS